MEEEQVGHCQSCWLEFSLDDPAITIVGRKTSSHATIVFEGKCHSLLIGRAWDKMCERRRLENMGGKRLGDGYLNVNDNLDAGTIYRDAAGDE